MIAPAAAPAPVPAPAPAPTPAAAAPAPAPAASTSRGRNQPRQSRQPQQQQQQPVQQQQAAPAAPVAGPSNRKKYVAGNCGEKYIHHRSICKDYNKDECTKQMDEHTRKCQRKFLHICNVRMAKFPCGLPHPATKHSEHVA